MLFQQIADPLPGTMRETVGPLAGASPSVVCFPFAGGIAGGSHVSAFQLIKSLDPSEFTPLVLLHSDCGQVAELLRSEGIAYSIAPVADHFGRARGVDRDSRPLRIARAIAGQWQLARFLRERRVRIVHTNDGAMHVSWALPAKLAGAKLLWHHRSDPGAFGVRRLAPWMADHVVSVSRFAGSSTRKVPASVIYSPFDTELPKVDRVAARAQLLDEVGLAPDTRLLCFFGNFVPRKRPFRFVEVIAELRRQAPHLPVAGLMFGASFDGSLEPQLRQAAQSLGVDDRIHLMGYRYPPEPWMAGSDLHLVTAVDEPFGRSLIEAMLLGTPVVAVRSGGNVEAIDHGRTGLLVPPDSPSAMAQAVLELLNSPAAVSAIAAAARNDAQLRYGVATHRDSIAAIYRTLLSEGDRHG
ncbi:glycosyltransferase family 4 protein [Sphingomonas arenae]|uniref:glycosyltransferase family 4 protein n=1 Tax=Sphingomonas arenae TaxID=2812555 RepID=UPI001967A43A|nr:glycosyltransferase family 4 protein [Sphingomonas arenae]